MENERQYYIRSIAGGLKRRATKEEATRAMSDAADAGHPYKVLQKKSFWNKTRMTIVEV